jgi:hypothetical protein
VIDVCDDRDVTDVCPALRHEPATLAGRRNRAPVKRRRVNALRALPGSSTRRAAARRDG